MTSEIDTKYITEQMNEAMASGIQTLIDVAKSDIFDNADIELYVTDSNRAGIQIRTEKATKYVDLLDITEALISKKLPNAHRLQNIGRLICALDEIKAIAELEIKRVTDLGDTVVVMPE